MPSVKEFKFNCPGCGQHILASTEWIGRKINCPSCKTPITIPPTGKDTRKKVLVLPSTPAPPAAVADGKMRAAAPGEGSKIPAPAALKVASGVKRMGAEAAAKVEAPAPRAAAPDRLRVAALTPAVTLDIVRAVRRRIASESSWLPGRVLGTNVYAARISQGQTVAVDAKDPQATRFSLMGAILREFHSRKVVRTATGRTEFLDHEIPDAIREVLLKDAGEADPRRRGETAADIDPMAISHAQCLAVLDLLERRYAQRIEQSRMERARRKIADVRLADLVKKLEEKAPVEAEEVATALYHELAEVRRRLDRLETRAGGAKATSS
jgi:hypothetical protein